MSDHDALLLAILDNPDDDAPRLVFADYVQESGDEDRAAFIRDQIELAKTPE
ncbi:MAG: TIGR02996 domain-containing protein, partial [Planctomycetia bacterium]|nr:TIGR02996 domain-containing protein [Planctomycetia bacterium]